MVPSEEAEDVFIFEASKDETRVIDWPRWPTLTECPNCRRLHLEGLEDGGRIATYRRDDSRPRVWADFSIRDDLDRVLLTAERSLTEIRSQRLLLNPPVWLVLYDDDGNEATGHAELGLTPDGRYDETLWAVILEAE